jgi:hypothetical protein
MIEIKSSIEDDRINTNDKVQILGGSYENYFIRFSKRK